MKRYWSRAGGEVVAGTHSVGVFTSAAIAVEMISHFEHAVGLDKRLF